MRTGSVLTLAVAVSLLSGCGTQDPGTTAGRSGIIGEVRLGPQCPVEAKHEPCRDEPAAGVPVEVAEQLPGEAYTRGEVVARTTTDVDGAYRVAVAPGGYVVTAEAGMSCELMDAEVVAGAFLEVDVPCDTGIR